MISTAIDGGSTGFGGGPQRTDKATNSRACAEMATPKPIRSARSNRMIFLNDPSMNQRWTARHFHRLQLPLRPQMHLS